MIDLANSLQPAEVCQDKKDCCSGSCRNEEGQILDDAGLLICFIEEEKVVSSCIKRKQMIMYVGNNK